MLGFTFKLFNRAVFQGGGTPAPPVSGAIRLEAGAGYLVIEGGTSHLLLE